MEVTMPNFHQVVWATGVISAFLVLGKAVKHYLLRKRLLKAVAERRALREKQIKIFEAEASVRAAIIALSFEELLSATQSGKHSAVEVLHAFADKSVKAHKQTNCVVEFLVGAFKLAEDLDSNGDRSLPLFGIPFSVKECFSLKGHDVTLGWVQDLGKTKTANATFVDALLAYGAIPFVRTNLPQSQLNYNCVNPIYGLTVNPYNSSRTPGGSSGGEAALLALNGAPFGIGGDVGGSIRIPCHYSGVSGIKPTKSRLCQMGGRGSVPGRPMTCASLGPMSTYPQVVTRVMQLLVDSPLMQNADPYMTKMPWKRTDMSKPLNVGYYANDGWFQATPACERAVNVVVEQLRASGHNVIPFRPPSVKQGIGLFMGSVTVDGGAYFRRMLKNDLAEPNHAEIYRMIYIPQLIRTIGLQLIGGRMFDTFGHLAYTSEQLRQVYEKVEVYRQSWVEAWKEAKLDILICPPNVAPALPHHYTSKVPSTCSYTGIFNTLDYPAGVVPVTRVTQDDVIKCKSDYPTTDRWYRLIKSVNCTEEVIGLPVGVQVVAMHLNDEMCTHVMELVADANKNWNR